jgi:hypothetical protein
MLLVLYVLRFRLKDLMSGDLWRYVGLYAEPEPQPLARARGQPLVLHPLGDREVMLRSTN